MTRPATAAAQLNEYVRRAHAALSPGAYAAHRLRDDPAIGDGAPELAVLNAAFAIADGKAMADGVLGHLGCDPYRIAAAYDVAVEECDWSGDYGAIVVYANYTARPCRVQLFRPNIDTLQLAFEASGLVERDSKDVTKMFLAHELYHHLDESRAVPLCRRYAATWRRIGPWRLTREVPYLREIAAAAFAQRLIDMPFDAQLCDLVTLFLRNPQYAELTLRQFQHRRQ